MVRMQYGYGGHPAGVGAAPLSSLMGTGFGMTYGLGGAAARLAGSLGDVFSFTVAGGEVTGAAVTLPWGATLVLPVGAGVDYSVAGADVLATRTGPGGISQVRYGDVDGDGLFQPVGAAHVFTTAPLVNFLGFAMRETLQVTTAGGAVTAVTQILPNGAEWVRLSGTVDPPDVAWTLQAGMVVETRTWAGGATSWEVFRDGNGDGRYTEVASGTGPLVDLVGVVAATDPVAAAL